MTEPLPLGTIGVTPTYGNKFDKFIGGAIRWATATQDNYHGLKNAPVNHAVVYVGPVIGYDKPQLVQAQPGGASFADWDSYGDQMIWLTVMLYTPTDAARAKIIETAKDLAIKRVGYGFLDFLGIALAQRRFGYIVNPNRPPWWVRRLGSNKHMICSQLADYCWERAGVQLFKNRIPGLVTPEDLYLNGGAPTHPAEA